MEGETVWLSQRDMAELFETTKQVHVESCRWREQK